MSFKEHLASLSQEQGHETFHDAVDITETPEGRDRLTEIIEKYPVLRGMIAALLAQIEVDEAHGVFTETEINCICLGFDLATGSIALIAESEIQI